MTSRDDQALRGPVLFSFGSNSNSQLSLNHKEDVHTPTCVALPRPLLPDEKILKIAAGGNHTLLLISGNRNSDITHDETSLFVVGDNSQNQSGIPVESRIEVFNTIPPPTSLVSPNDSEKLLVNRETSSNNQTSNLTTYWIDIAAGWQFSLLLSNHNSLIVCGTGPRGELGLGPDTLTTTSLSPIPAFPPANRKIIQLTASVEHVLTLLDNGDVYGWGNGRKGQLGPLSAGEKYIWSPRRILFPQGFIPAAVAVGREFTAAIDAEGRVVVIGSDKWGVISSNPFNEEGVRWKRLAAGWSSIYILTEDGKVVGWGRNTHGQMPPEGLEELQELAVGSEHAIGVTKTGEVVAWGWGEHGNCGEFIKEEGEVVKWVKKVPVEGLTGRVKGVAAGCATSWVWG